MINKEVKEAFITDVKRLHQELFGEYYNLLDVEVFDEDDEEFCVNHSYAVFTDKENGMGVNFYSLLMQGNTPIMMTDYGFSESDPSYGFDTDYIHDSYWNTCETGIPETPEYLNAMKKMDTMRDTLRALYPDFEVDDTLCEHTGSSFTLSYKP